VKFLLCQYVASKTILVFAAKLDALPPAQRNLWPRLSFTAGLGFTLYGGTAIAIQLGHRVSVDFDFFRSESLSRNELFNAAPFLAEGTVIQDEENTLTILVADRGIPDATVKISFFGRIDFGFYEPPDATSDGVLLVASMYDLLATKLKVILQRAEAKDYIDIVALIGANIDLAKGLAIAREMFAPSFQPSESLKALSYFKDGDLFRRVPIPAFRPCPRSIAQSLKVY
jgi:Nucleotidyl transferase AbiEii toxin, Type IV TA system